MIIKNRNLFRLTRFLIFALPGIFRLIAKFKTRQKRLLIVKTDAIGDYILFRNFIEVVRTSTLYHDFQIDLLGNALWQDIAVKYDSKYVSNFIFINPDSLYEAPWRLLKLARQLFTNNYQVVLHPTSSRTLINDALCAFTSAKNIVGFLGDTERIRGDYKTKTDEFYTELIALPASIYFEFDRSNFFFEMVLGQTINLKNAELPAAVVEKKGIIIFPGSGVFKRNWEPAKFLALAQYLMENTDELIYLAGGKTELDLCGYLAENLPPDRIQNMAGKTSLPQLIDLIAGARLLISNETSATHIAATTGTKCICILGGGHFSRFLPYQHHVKNAPACVYKQMDCYNCNWNCTLITNANEPYPCLSAISLAQVWDETMLLLAQQA